MISSAHPDLPAFLAHLKRVEEARKFVAEFDEWLDGRPSAAGRRIGRGAGRRRVARHVGDDGGLGGAGRRDPPP